MTQGGRNLIILGVSTIAVTCLMTGVSLAIYHNSGDIYLDRSRPGFLPDKEELEQDEIKVESYEFSKDGKITKEALEEYLEKLYSEMKVIEAFKDPFSAEALSDERLGIPGGVDGT